MAQIDMKKCYLRMVDGRKAVLTTTAGVGVNGELVLTDASTHRGTQPPPTITIVNPGTTHSLSGVLTGTDLVITAGYATGAITTTAAALKTFIDAISGIGAVMTTAQAGDGTGLISAQTITPFATGPRSLQLKVAEGTLDYTEKKPRIYTKNMGHLDGIRDGDEEPLEAKLDCIWEFIKASTGSGTPTPEDVLKNRGEAAAWVTTDADPCNPYAIDLELEYAPNCNSVQREFLTLQCFRYEDIAHALKDGVLKFAGKCNVTEAISLRAA